MSKSKVQSLKCYCILHIESIKFEKDIKFPVFIRVARVRKSGIFERVAFNSETNYSMLDANLVAQFDCEFIIPITLYQKEGHKLEKKILDIEIFSLDKNQGQNCISKVRMDIANLTDPRSTARQTSNFQTNKFGTAQLNFRLCVLPIDEFPNGKPQSYFSFVTIRSVKPIIEEVESMSSTAPDLDETQGLDTSTADTIVFDNSFHHLNANGLQGHMTLSSFTKEIAMKKAKPVKHSESSSRKKSNRKQIQKFYQQRIQEVQDKKAEEEAPQEKPAAESITFLDAADEKQINLINAQKPLIAQINFDQCLTAFAVQCFNCLVTPQSRQKDYSKDLISVIQEYHIMENPMITPEVFEYIHKPFYDTINFALSKDHSIPSIFGIFATAINYGLLLSDTCADYTKAHQIVLDHIQQIIMNIVSFLITTLMSHLVLAIMGDGFDALDRESLSNVTQSIRIFSQLSKSFNIPEVIVQGVVIDCCHQFDAMLFNLIIETADEYTDAKLDILVNHIKEIQKVFDCLSSNFTTAFTIILGFITTAKALISGIERKRIIPSPLLRSIAERCSPLQLPAGVKLEDLGPVVPRDELRKEKPSPKYTFTFESLFTDSATGNFD
ncbi:hypothetical protein TVAG_399600 [Trichomonas vaginalis G3]|uniref:C2 NT-type domain-containing protein n=1 Tax=Trichomonas vaginalis (strain ATCC PRA-98 / G3) TaxID=412133 RepID=A2E5Z7_TRIV3|nr:N-terminal C2 in EEIG1 and EHBP1 proteins family [Trichomonas vaginalis G3]EAY11954.1 hypothetical protein TVAG_399600 [Trichomonas vaginalis G3]KAI5530381.1 N-terminal C2 in EEIG1 and EHBP1 proteins family [Trichomonas vaginalis G3]|eukprot:XP_001324177.1 hypothetical protein [Trichomonas vaginalis G3]